MRDFPQDVNAYKKTPIFNQDSIPAGLLKSHSTKVGTWGKIIVLEGCLIYRILEPMVEEVLLMPDKHGVVEPCVKHEVAPQGAVRFYVEFYK